MMKKISITTIRIEAENSENDETTVLPEMITPNIIETRNQSSNDPIERMRLACEKYEGEIKSFTEVEKLKRWIATSDKKSKFCFKGFVVSIEPNLKFERNDTIVTRIK